MKRQHLALVVCLPLSLVGVGLSVGLLRMHAEGANYTGLLSGACGGEKKGCDKVIHSGWGWFPPAPEEGEPVPENREASAEVGPPAPPSAGSPAPPNETTSSKEGRIPVAALGFFYFATLAVWFAAVGAPSWNRRRLHFAVVGLCVVGAMGSAWFIVVMAAFIKAWCPVCLSSHVVNFLILGTVLFSRPKQAASGGKEAAAAQAIAVDAHLAGVQSLILDPWRVNLHIATVSLLNKKIHNTIKITQMQLLGTRRECLGSPKNPKGRKQKWKWGINM